VRKTDKPEAFRIWPEAVAAVAMERRCDHGDAAAWLRQRAADYAASDQGRGQYCRGPVPWLNQAAWNDPPETWNGRHDVPTNRVASIPSGGTAVFNAETGEIVIKKEGP